MSSMVQYGDEVIRIDSNNDRILEAGTLNSCNYYNWQMRHTSYTDHFYDLMVRGNRIIAQTSSGMQHSDDGGYCWYPGC